MHLQEPSRFIQRTLVPAILLMMISVSALHAQSPARITQRIDNKATVRVSGSAHPLANARNDAGRIDRDLAMNRMMLVLKPSEAQEVTLTQLLNQQQDPDSATFQHWLSPQEFGTQFGPADEDVVTITSWLQQQGLRVESVSRGKQFIEFSGTAGQVEDAFQTEMHRYVVDGKEYVANARDISLPAAVTAVVSGVLSLHNFPKKPLHHTPYRVHRDPRTGQLAPDFTLTTSQGAAHFLAPGDFAKIYNSSPLLAQKVTGAGVSIAIAGRTDIQLADVRTFRKIFKLPAKDPTFILNGVDPGITGDEVEGNLDVEWSGAVAPEADIKFVVSASTVSTDGVDLSIAYIIDNRIAPIMSTSYGQCEAFLGAVGNAFFNNIYQQAAAEGITAFVSSGDNGVAGCDASAGRTPARYGANVSGLASTPFNIAVGGTEFNENGLDDYYWNANNSTDQASAVGYIPEVAWNESCDPTTDPTQCGSGLYLLFSSAGGPSSCVQSQTANYQITCLAGYSKPAWQAGGGILDDGVRDVPDVALAAAGHDGYLVCSEGACQTAVSNGQTILESAIAVGGTSASSPAMAGVMALVEQKHGQFQGLANYNLYKLHEGEDLSACNASNLTDPDQSNHCVFRDVTAGNNSVPGQKGYPAKAGYDLTTGLGSVNVANLVAAWGETKKLHSKTHLSSGAISAQHGQPVPIDVTVKPAHGAGAASGGFSLQTDQYGSVFGGIVARGKFSGTVADLPGGSYKVAARYGGDAMLSGSTSASVPVNITPENSSLTTAGWVDNLIGRTVPLYSPVFYGQPIGLQIDVAGKSGVGSATGSVTILDGTKALGTFPLGQNGTAFVQVDTLSPSGFTVGTHSLSALYSGDNSFLPSFSKPVTFSVIKKSPQSLIRPAFQTVTVSDQVELSLEVIPLGASDFPADGLLPSGTVQVFDTATNQPISGKIPLVYDGLAGPGSAQAVFKTSSLSVGRHALKLVYDGDSNYNSVAFAPFTHASFVIVSPANGILPVIHVEQSPATVPLGQSANYVVSVKPHKSGATPTGTVSITSTNNFVLAGPVTLTNGNASLLITFASAGQQMLAVRYSGDKIYSADSSATIITRVSLGTPKIHLKAAARSVEENTQTSLTVTVVGAPGNPILSSAVPSGAVQFFDSLDGGAPQPLGAPQFLTRTGNGTPTNSLPVILPAGSNLITAQYLGDLDWAAAESNSVTVHVK